MFFLVQQVTTMMPMMIHGANPMAIFVAGSLPSSQHAPVCVWRVQGPSSLPGKGGEGGEGGDGGGPSHSLLPEEQRLGLSFWDLLHCIVDMEPPALPAAVKGVSFAPPFTAFVSACLAKDQAARPSADALLAHPWLTESQPHLVDISTWLQKSHDEDAIASPSKKA